MLIAQLLLFAALAGPVELGAYTLIGFAGCYFSLDRMRTVYCQWRARQASEFFLSSRSILVVSAVFGIVVAFGLVGTN